MTALSLTSQARIGILGGSFDPIHFGHLLMAEYAREELQLDQVVFIPAAVSPLKLDNTPRASNKDRLEMVRLATGGNSFFSVDDRELARGGTSYTVDTLRELKAENPEASLFFLMGADSLASFHRWQQPSEICRLASLAVLARGGHASPDLEFLTPFLPKDSDLPNKGRPEHQVLKMPQIEISASGIRRRIFSGLSTLYQLHPAVQAYIDANHLYQVSQDR